MKHIKKITLSEQIAKHKKPTLREEANAITSYAFRNGFIEDLHAGVHSKLLENPKYSRITDEEMKKLMVESSAKVEAILKLKYEKPKHYYYFIKFMNLTYSRNWNKKKKHQIRLKQQRA